jgi:predicted nucleic acid-binding protein
MKNVLFDTNIILDIALKRVPYFENALLLFNLMNESKIQANITATTITDIYYIVRKTEGHELAIEFILKHNWFSCS